MKGRSAICSEVELKRKNETEVCGLWSVPDEVILDCLAHLSKLDLVALAMVSRRHRFLPVSLGFRAMRMERGRCDPYLYVFMQMHPDPGPRWFVLHPVQRRLKRVKDLYPAPVKGSCFVKSGWGIYTIGGLINGKPTSEFTYFDCTDMTAYPIKPMKMARSGASASLIEGKKIYVFGGCWDVADSSNWVEVYDIETSTWEFLSVSTPKIPLRIKQSVVIYDEKYVYAVDEDGQFFFFSPSESMFHADERRESNPENRNDWCLAVVDKVVFCRGVGGRVLWSFPGELDWKEVKGLEELRQEHCGFDIIKLCIYSDERMAIFWEARPQGPDQILELWCAEVSLRSHKEGEVWEVWGKVELSGAVLSDSSCTGLNLLYAGSLYV